MHRAASKRHAAGFALDDGLLPPVVEPGGAFRLEGHASSDDADNADETVVVRRDSAGNRHEVDDLADPVDAHEARNQDRRTREVHLAIDRLAHRPNTKKPATLLIEQ